MCRRLIRGTEGNIKGQYVKIIRNFRALEEKNSLVERGPFLYVNDKIVYSGAKKKSEMFCSEFGTNREMDPSI